MSEMFCFQCEQTAGDNRCTGRQEGRALAEDFGTDANWRPLMLVLG